jgi:sugar (pentulose or hexulose) kinase
VRGSDPLLRVGRVRLEVLCKHLATPTHVANQRLAWWPRKCLESARGTSQSPNFLSSAMADISSSNWMSTIALLDLNDRFT